MLLLSINFAAASAWVRSILPFITALLVNSPGVASTAPSFMHSSIILLADITPPWH